ncbi:ferredoxin [Acidihalobacter aeolianus]|uniref:Ferredoxin-like protein n=1 Tax=Acidihalobacter aeolianus TaxID=2792603 RepID=A0A1D8KA15_9GAMM|nr:ferredoxin family protein [Acidihalobacter aeolianus]AOV17776.1 ferredoxin [Acidihalobacter aeolianus]
MSTNTATPVKIEEKLFQNRYRVDEGHPHISVRDSSVCRDACQDKACTFCCPAGCYAPDASGGVTLSVDGCLECGTCRIICAEHQNVEWWYPRGGYGILFKFG